MTHDSARAEMTQLQVLYVAFGYAFLVKAINSARTVRISGTESSIKLITNLPVTHASLDGIRIFDEIIFVNSEDEDNRLTKIGVFDYADSPCNLYLDCDTEVLRPLHVIAPVMQCFDLAARCLPFSTARVYELPHADTENLSISEINTGVIFFSKSERSRQFFHNWRNRFESMPFSQDQPSFLRALFETDVKLIPLGVGWNCTPNSKFDLHFVRSRPKDVRILHYRDPIFWPEAGADLARIHTDAEIKFSTRSKMVENQIASYEWIARQHGRWLFQYSFGRKYISWTMRRTKEGPKKLRMRGKTRARARK